MSILHVSHPSDSREGWLDVGKGAVIYNVGHPLVKQLDGPFGRLSYHNKIRVVISTLVKEANEKQQMDAKEGLLLFEKVYHALLLS